jgi:hypothetical protein
MPGSTGCTAHRTQTHIVRAEGQYCTIFRIRASLFCELVAIPLRPFGTEITRHYSKMSSPCPRQPSRPKHPVTIYDPVCHATRGALAVRSRLTGRSEVPGEDVQPCGTSNYTVTRHPDCTVGEYNFALTQEGSSCLLDRS